MAKINNNEIPDFQTDWGDDGHGLQYSGARVQEFIKKYLVLGNTANQERWGTALFDVTSYSLIGFKDEDNKAKYLETGDKSLIVGAPVPFSFTGTVNQLKIINNMSSGNLYFTAQAKEAIIECSFLSQEKGITDSAWSDVNEDFEVTVSIDKGNTGVFEPLITSQSVLNGNTFTFDVRNAIATGANRVRVSAKGVDTGATGAFTYTVNLTTMYLADAKFQWNVPFIQNETFALGGMYIGGELDKKLRIRMTNERGYLMEYEVPIGITTSEAIPYYFGGLEFPVSETTGGTGVYNVELWLDANGLQSEHLSYNIICVAQADKATAQLVAISNAAKVAVNDTSNKLFDYVVYNGGKSNADPIINVDAIINGTTKSLVTDKVLAGVVTGTINTYTLEFLIETEESDVQIHSTIELGKSKQEAIHLLDNSKSYPAEKGAWFYMNPNNRSNSDTSKESIINESSLPSAERVYTATWTNVSFVNGMDGWTVDNEGRSCLRLPAGSKVEIDCTPFLNQSTLTIEACYKVENASDFNEDVIRIASSAASDFVGMRVKPTNIVLHSQLKKKEDILQGYNLKDEETVHLLVTIVKDYKFVGNLAQIYVNGVPKCSFEWEVKDTFSHGGKIVLGSDTADLNIYKLRVYRDVIQEGTTVGVSGAFEWVKAVRNFISCLPDKKSKDATYIRMHSVIDDGNKLDYEKVRNAGKNYFVVRLPKGRQIPSKTSPSSVPGCTLTVNIQQNKNFPVNGVFEDTETEGQGTTAMNYWLYNLRWKTSLIRITAKKNFASSMHSHKMGATALFNDLHKIIVGQNEAKGRVAVEQYGAYGFAEMMDDSGKYVMVPLGLYTIGQDKGDKPTFGYNDPEYKDTLIHMEGSDHSPKSVGMEYPWSKLGVYTDKEGDQYLGELKADGTVEKAWEIGACGAAKTDKDALAYLTQEFKPAYDMDYHNTSLIVGLPSGTTIAQVNANLSAFRATPTDNGFTYADCLIWIDGKYDTYYFNNISGKYEEDGLNILTDLGISASDLTGSVEDKTRQIRSLRMQRYRDTMEQYWHLRDSLFHYCFIVLFAATDNFKKNTYPYKFGTLESGSRWRWRQDDLDTLFDINNQGLANKIYSLLNGDKNGTTHIFQGNNSYHWTNIQFYYENEIKQMMLDIMTAMAEMGEGDSLIEKAIDCIRKYFWAKAQEYFTETAYNNDAEITYEDAWAALKTGKYDAPVDPLQQSLGSHYEAEKAFVELRFIFMASLYGFGAFGIGNDADTTLGQMTFRPARGDHHFSLTPSINMNPTILIGDSNSKSEERRLMAGETAEIDLSTDGDTSIYLQGLDYLTDIGDLSKQQFYDQNPVITALISKRLQTLKLGDADASQVTTNLKEISNINCPSLSEMDARNVSTLQGNIDLSKCPRIRKALYGGTAATGITLPKGSKITEFELPDTIQNLTLLNLPNLTSNTYREYEAELQYTKQYYATNQGVGNKCTYTVTTDTNVAGGLVIDLDSVNSIKITGKGGNTPRLWCFVDSTDTIISCAETQATATNLLLTIPSNARKCIVQFVASNSYQVIINKGEQGGLRYGDLTVLTYLRVEGNKHIDGFGLLKATFEDGAPLSNIRIIGFDYSGNADDAAMIASLAKGGYYGIDENGSPNYNIIPVLEGTLNIDGSIYEEDKEYIDEQYKGRITLNVTGGFYMKFQDPEVLSVLLANGVGDGVGITTEQVKNVTSIGTWFKGNTAITSFDEFEKFTGVTYLNNENFQDCSNLNSIILPNTFTEFRRGGGNNNGVFKNCSSLEYINLDKVVSMGGNVFYNTPKLMIDVLMPSLKTFDLSTNFTQVRVFGSSGITRFVAENLETISGYFATSASNPGATDCYGMFANCKNLKYVDLGGKITSLPSSTFANCENLEEVVGLESIITLGSNNFYNCKSLKSINLPNCTTIHVSTSWYNHAAFMGSGIETIYAPKVTSLSAGDSSYSAFRNCTSLVTVDMNLQTIAQYSFYNCTSLANIDLSNVVTSGQNAFYNCTSLEFEDLQLPNLTSLGQNAFYGVKIKKMVLGKEGGTLTLPAGSSTTQNYGDKSVLEEVVLPDTLTSIPANSFSGYVNLTSINLNTIQAIQGSAFFGTAIPEVTLDNIVTIGGYALANCKQLKKVIIGNNITSIAEYAFQNDSLLDIIIVQSLTPPSLGAGAFRYINSGYYIYVPDASVEAYKTASGWSNYADRIKPLSEYDVRILTYNEDGNGGYNLYQIANYDTAKNDYVMGIAIHGDNGDFVMHKDVVSGGNPWVATNWYNNGAHLGYENTNLMLAAYPDETNTYIHNKCHQTTFANGNLGYLMSDGEGIDIWRRRDAIANAFAKIETTFDYTSRRYWSSSMGHEGNKWMSTLLMSSDSESTVRGGAGNYGAATSYISYPITKLPEGLEW